MPALSPLAAADFRRTSFSGFIIVERVGPLTMTVPQSTTDAAVPASIRSDQAKLVYLYLDRAGGATPDAVAGALALPKLAVLGVLGALSERGFVEERDGRYRAI